MKSATLNLSVSHVRAHVPAVLALIERGVFDPAQLAPLVGDWNDADRVLLEPATKVVVRRSRLTSADALQPSAPKRAPLP